MRPELDGVKTPRGGIQGSRCDERAESPGRGGERILPPGWKPLPVGCGGVPSALRHPCPWL